MKIDDQMKAKLNLLKEIDIKPNFAELARQSGIDYRTIKRYYDGYEGKPSTRNKPSKLDPYRDLIQKKLEIERVSIRGVYEFLIDQNGEGVIGTYSNFAKYVKHEKLLPKKKPKGFPRFETEKGYQAQVDWKEDITLHTRTGDPIVFNIFNLELGYSRFNAVYYSRFKEQYDVFRCLIKAFKQIGGIPAEIVFDNMSTAAVTTTKSRRKRVNPEMRKFAADLDFKPYLCMPGHCYTKGKIESRNKILDWIRPYDYEFEDEDELVQIIENVIQLKMNKYECQGTGFPPALLLQEEMAHLKPLPPHDVLETYLGPIRQTVLKDSLVYYKGNRYSVSPDLIGERVGIERREDKIYIYHNETLISVHDVFSEYAKKQIRYREEDYKELMSSHYRSDDNEKMEEKIKENLAMMDRLIGERNVQSTDKQSDRAETV